MPNRSDPNAGAQETPGRPKSSSSRQQTHRDQSTQTGSPEIDKRNRDREAQEPARKVAEVAYDDRPSEDGKHGDGDQEPNPRPN